jgi:hypothetical protein
MGVRLTGSIVLLKAKDTFVCCHMFCREPVGNSLVTVGCTEIVAAVCSTTATGFHSYQSLWRDQKGLGKAGVVGVGGNSAKTILSWY